MDGKADEAADEQGGNDGEKATENQPAEEISTSDDQAQNDSSEPGNDDKPPEEALEEANEVADNPADDENPWADNGM